MPASLLMMTTLEDIADHRIIPVVTITDPQRAPGLADALVAGGLPIVEITLRTSAGVAAIRAISGRGDVIVGAGTVRTVEQADAAIDAGAEFLVSPGFSARLVEHCQARGVALLPGCVTPSELMAAQELGVQLVKFFPAETYGGVAGLKALAAPFSDVTFVPTGGVNLTNLDEYLALPCVAAVGGTWMVPTKAIDDEDFFRIEMLTRDAVELRDQLCSQ